MNLRAGCSDSFGHCVFLVPVAVFFDQWSLDQSESEWEQEVMGQLGPPHGQSEWGAQVVCWPKGLVWGSH